MRKTITASVTYVIQDRTDPDDQNRQDHRDPNKPWELMDSDNFRDAFVDSVEEAEQRVRYLLEDALGLSGGVALGVVDITTEE